MKTLLLIGAVYFIYRYFQWRERLKEKANSGEVHHHHHYHVGDKDMKKKKDDYIDFEDLKK